MQVLGEDDDGPLLAAHERHLAERFEDPGLDPIRRQRGQPLGAFVDAEQSEEKRCVNVGLESELLERAPNPGDGDVGTVSWRDLGAVAEEIDERQIGNGAVVREAVDFLEGRPSLGE